MRKTVLMLAALLAAPHASAYTQVIAFGDSLSDTGHFYAATFGLYPPAPAYDNGRFSNGPVAVEYLADALNVPLTSLAWGGATTGDTNYAGIAFGIPGLPGLAQQIDGYTASLGGGGADADALHVVFAGGNDFFLAEQFPLLYPGGPQAVINTAMLNLADAVQTLESAGARHILVPNLPDFDGWGDEYALALDTLLTDLENTAGFDATLYTTDVYGLFNSLLADPLSHGFTHIATPCVSTTSLIPPVISVCSGDLATQNEYILWDDTHPTTAVHALLGEAMASAVTPVPEPQTYALFGAGLALVVAAARGRLTRHA